MPRDLAPAAALPAASPAAPARRRPVYSPVPRARPSAADPVIAHLRRPPPNAVIHPHRHPWGQLSFPISGSLRITAGGTTWLVPAMRAVWIPPDVEHNVVVLGTVRFYACYIAPQACALSADSCAVLEVSPLLRELMEALAHDDTLGERRRQLCASLLVEELAAAPTLSLGLALPSDRRLQALCHALMEDPGSSLTLSEWAARTGASERTLARLFESELKTSFGSWRQQLRLAHAIDLMSRGRPLAHVAAETGYAHAGAFSTMFRRALGQTPRDFMARRRRVLA
ncbi:helix-turn-helix domain-containing protein [Cupriavidus sp. L7L]|uniref:AraC family transcriptional regulator n=1 Tax=Cupriavidus sp. L7L TaxID=2546443 RepID=UPI0010554D21|nr:helix-turn-helix transcriptional regulator [Cupriavidus sp. L7L]TDF65112.1 AraC family transcriptional regulator [Cupriavidus sp. L7L]